LKWEWLLVVVILAGTLTYGFQQVAKKQEKAKTAEPVNAAVVQANIDQSVKWKPRTNCKPWKPISGSAARSPLRAPI
jgi:apolipoprotein N-acyltransferase